jgi:hypothetical protein
MHCFRVLIAQNLAIIRSKVFITVKYDFQRVFLVLYRDIPVERKVERKV